MSKKRQISPIESLTNISMHKEKLWSETSSRQKGGVFCPGPTGPIAYVDQQLIIVIIVIILSAIIDIVCFSVTGDNKNWQLSSNNHDCFNTFNEIAINLVI